MIRDTLTMIERLGGDMKSFDEWFGEASQNKLFWESPSKASKMGYEAGAQSRQAEIDELKKRIDEVIEYVGSDFDDYYTGTMVESIHEILKGNQND